MYVGGAPAMGAVVGLGDETPKGFEATWLHLNFATAVVVTVLSGTLHGISMGMRKKAGEEAARHDRSFYTSRDWWLGFGVDFIGGATLWFAMPVLAVQQLLPICLTSQVMTAYFIGRLWLGETANLRKNLGVLFSIMGVALLAYTVTEPKNFPANQFWVRWAHPGFLQTLSLLAVLTALASLADTHLGWVFVASFSDAVQFLCSRTLATAILYHDYPLEVWLVLALKIVLCMVFLHFQQLALKGPLSRVGAEYPVIDSLLTTVLAAPFFGDRVEISRQMWGGAIATAVGLALLMESTALWGSDELSYQEAACLLGEEREVPDEEKPKHGADG